MSASRLLRRPGDTSHTSMSSSSYCQRLQQASSVPGLYECSDHWASITELSQQLTSTKAIVVSKATLATTTATTAVVMLIKVAASRHTLWVPLNWAGATIYEPPPSQQPTLTACTCALDGDRRRGCLGRRSVSPSRALARV